MGKVGSVEDNLKAIEWFLEHHQDKCSAWELDFLDSIHDRLASGRNLTPKQQDVLDRLWREIVENDRRG